MPCAFASSVSNEPAVGFLAQAATSFSLPATSKRQPNICFVLVCLCQPAACWLTLHSSDCHPRWSSSRATGPVRRAFASSPRY